MKNILSTVSALALVGGLGITPASAGALLSLNKPVTCSGYTATLRESGNPLPIELEAILLHR
jgi:hypothetical protein